MKKRLIVSIIVIYTVFFHTLYGSSTICGEELAKKLHLQAGYKAIVQWERIFKSPRKKKRYKIDTLSKEEQEALKSYLISHAIDSDHPTVAGEY